jgi:hypothetical protein
LLDSAPLAYVVSALPSLLTKFSQPIRIADQAGQEMRQGNVVSLLEKGLGWTFA